MMNNRRMMNGMRTMNLFPNSNTMNVASGASNAIKNAPIDLPRAKGIATLGGLGSIASKGKALKFGSILTGVQKTIGTVNQVVPLYKQIKPMIANGKTFLNIMKSVKSDDIPSTTEKEEVVEIKKEEKETVTVGAPQRKIDLTPKTQPSKPFFVE